MVRLTQVFGITTSSTGLNVADFTVNYNVVAALSYDGSLNISDLSSIVFYEGPGDDIEISGTFSGTNLRTEINDSMDGSWNSVTLTGDDSALIDVSTNTAWDGSLGDAFDTCVGASIRAGNGGSGYSYDVSDDHIKGIHFIDGKSQFETAANNGDLGSQVVTNISYDLSAGTLSACSGFIRDALEGFTDISDGSNLADLLDEGTLELVLKISQADSSGGNFTVSGDGNNPNSSSDSVTGGSNSVVVNCSPSTLEIPSISVPPCYFLLQWGMVNGNT